MENNQESGMIIYKNLLDNMTDGAFVIEYNGKIQLINVSAIQMLGYDEDHVIGKSMLDLMNIDKKNDEFFECILDAVYDKNQMSRIISFFRDETVRHLRVVVSPIMDKKNNIAVIVIISDMTELIDLSNKNKELNKKLSDFINRFVQMMVDNIDSRSHYNANHTRKMVKYADKYLDYLEENNRGISRKHRRAFMTSIWLHDIGKLLIPLKVLDKPSRLGNRINDIFQKIEVAVLCEKIKMLEAGDDPDATENGTKTIERLLQARELIEETDKKGFIDRETAEKIEAIKEMKCLNSSGEYDPLLTEYDKEALAVERGTLTKEERKLVESHVTHTYRMLKQMEFGASYKDVPEWAGNHHEFLDGSGYPNGIKADKITWETRLLTILDIFDALTAEDRPYKPPLPVEKAFEIMESMQKAGKLDAEILKDFRESGAWK